MAQNPQNPNGDFDVTAQAPVKDSISSLSFRPVAGAPMFLNATMWNGDVSCIELMSTGQAVVKAQQSYGANAPVLCSTWTSDGAAFLSGCADKVLRRWDLGTGQSTAVGGHEAPIKEVSWIPDMNVAVTGSWDKTLKVWDGRTSTNQAQMTMQVSERVYAMDSSSPLLVVGTADKKVSVFDLRKPQTPYKHVDSPLKLQTRSIACFHDKRGYAVGSIEGRVGIEHVDDSEKDKNFAFKCHRDGNNIFAVNCISFHKQLGSFVTGGSDGTLHIWDKDSRQRLKPFNKMASPITAVAWNADGTLLAYAASYDWSKGAYEANKTQPQIMVHTCQEGEVKPRPKQPGKR